MVQLLGGSMGFKDNLKRFREAKGWTQAQTALAAKVPFRSYQNWEAGIREPRLDALVRLASAFGVTADVILDGIGSGESGGQTAAVESTPQVPRPTGGTISKRK